MYAYPIDPGLADEHLRDLQAVAAHHNLLTDARHRRTAHSRAHTNEPTSAPVASPECHPPPSDSGPRSCRRGHNVGNHFRDGWSDGMPPMDDLVRPASR